MTKLTATTANGTKIERNSKIAYTHIYAVTVESGRIVRLGFSRTADEAQKAAAREVAAIRKHGYGETVNGKFVKLNSEALAIEVLPIKGE